MARKSKGDKPATPPATPPGNPHGNRSRIEMEMSPEDKAEFDRLLMTGRMTLDSLALWLEGRGYEISRAAVHRYKSRTDKWRERLRKHQEAAEALSAELGEAAVQGKAGRLLVQKVRILVDDFVEAAEDGGATIDSKDIINISKGLAELARAARFDQDFETKVTQIRAAAEAEAKKGAAAQVQTAAREAGLSEEFAQEIVNKILMGAV